MELGEAVEAARDRYKRIVSRPEAFDELLVELYVESHRRAALHVGLRCANPTYGICGATVDTAGPAVRRPARSA